MHHVNLYLFFYGVYRQKRHVMLLLSNNVSNVSLLHTEGAYGETRLVKRVSPYGPSALALE